MTTKKFFEKLNKPKNKLKLLKRFLTQKSNQLKKEEEKTNEQ